MGFFSSYANKSGLDMLDLFTVGKAPSGLQNIKMLLTDVETEGQKQGYARAAKEYEAAFEIVESEFQRVKSCFDIKKTNLDGQSEALVLLLERLEREKAACQKEVDRNARKVADKHGISISDVKTSFGYSYQVDIVGCLISQYQENKLREAEQRGYVEAKKLYEAKLQKLKSELAELRQKCSFQVKEMLVLIDDLLDAIAKEQTNIAELKMLLG